MIERTEAYLNGYAHTEATKRMYGVEYTARNVLRLANESSHARDFVAGALDAAISLAMDARANGKLS